MEELDHCMFKVDIISFLGFSRNTDLAYGIKSDPSFVRLLLGRFPAQSLEACVQQVVTLVNTRVGSYFLKIASLHLEPKWTCL